MTLPGETLATGAPEVCSDCGVRVEPQVMSSAAGYYVGTRCDCGPYSRESGYFKTHQEVEAVLRTGGWARP